MDYGYKITTHGRRLLAACLDLGKPLQFTRAAVGSGLIDTDEDLAKSHALIHYVSEAAIADRRHEGDRLFMTVRYSNEDHKGTSAFTLSEFMVWAMNPETGQETDFLYAALGDFCQPVPAYSENFPASVFSYPMILAISSDLEIVITASPGLVTWEDLLETKAQIIRAIMMGEVTLPLVTRSGEALLTDSGTPIYARYEMAGSGTVMSALEERIATAKQEAIVAADEAADTKIAVHNTTDASHPTHLAITQKS